MKRKSKKTTTNPGPHEHFEAVGQLLTQLKTHLSSPAGKRGSYGDYLRLLDFYRDTSAAQAREIIVGWVDRENLVTEPPA